MCNVYEWSHTYNGWHRDNFLSVQRWIADRVYMFSWKMKVHFVFSGSIRHFGHVWILYPTFYSSQIYLTNMVTVIFWQWWWHSSDHVEQVWKTMIFLVQDPVFCVEQNSSDNFPQRLIFFFSVCPQCKQVPCLEEGIHALNLEVGGFFFYSLSIFLLLLFLVLYLFILFESHWSDHSLAFQSTEAVKTLACGYIHALWKVLF